MGKEGPCCHCGIEHTPLWRNGPPEKPVLCNACGSRWRTRGTLADYIPKHAMKDVHGGQTNDNSGQSGSTSTSGPSQLVFRNAPRRKRSDLDQYVLTSVGRLSQQLLDFVQEQPEVYLDKPLDGDVLIDRADVAITNPLGTDLGALLLVAPVENINPISSDQAIEPSVETTTKCNVGENDVIDECSLIVEQQKKTSLSSQQILECFLPKRLKLPKKFIKTGVEISKFLIGAIENVGSSNVLQVVTDNAANCKAVGREIEKVYKHIFWSPCCVHTLNLIFKDMGNEFYWLNDIYRKGKTIVKYFINHTHALSMFRENSKLDLLKVAKTRFASHYILLKRIMDLREALSTTIGLNSWRDWVKNGDENTRIVGAKVVDIIRDDSFWEDVESVLAITKPIFLLIKFCDGEGPKMGEIYEKMDNMLGEIKDIMQDNTFSSYYPQIERIILSRWEKMNIPLHCLGFALNPRFYDRHYLQKMATGGMQRKAPNQDKEVVQGVMEAFGRISENEEEGRMLREQFVTFHMKKGIYSMPATQTDAVTMDAIDWWSTYGAETPELAEVAKKVLSQPISSSSAERNWSTYSYIHNVKRNRLNEKRADKLVYIHSNIRLLSRFSESYKSGPHKNWDINPESTYIEG
ncbi:hypothetical protein LXL04_038722 [Taraxacum kok-saghyz]